MQNAAAAVRCTYSSLLQTEDQQQKRQLKPYAPHPTMSLDLLLLLLLLLLLQLLLLLRIRCFASTLPPMHP